MGHGSREPGLRRMNDFMIKSPDRWVFGPDRPVTSILDQVRYQEQEDDGEQD
jgi:hypothetical protein